MILWFMGAVILVVIIGASLCAVLYIRHGQLHLHDQLTQQSKELRDLRGYILGLSTLERAHPGPPPQRTSSESSETVPRQRRLRSIKGGLGALMLATGGWIVTHIQARPALLAGGTATVAGAALAAMLVPALGNDGDEGGQAAGPPVVVTVTPPASPPSTVVTAPPVGPRGTAVSSAPDEFQLADSDRLRRSEATGAGPTGASLGAPPGETTAPTTPAPPGSSPPGTPPPGTPPPGTPPPRPRPCVIDVNLTPLAEVRALCS